MSRPANVADYREAARRRLPRVLFDYIDGGSYAEETLARQRRRHPGAEAAPAGAARRLQAFHRDRDVRRRRCRCRWCSRRSGMAGMYARRGEAQAARPRPRRPACRSCLSTVGVCDVDGGGASVDAALVPALHAEGSRLHGRVLARAQARKAARCCCSPSTCRCPARAIATCATACWPRPRRPAAQRRRSDGIAHPGLALGRADQRRTAHARHRRRRRARGPEAAGASSGPGSGATSTRRSPGPTSTGSASAGRGPIVLKGVLDVADARQAARHRRRRDRGLQPRRAPARRRAVVDPRAAADRRGGRRRAPRADGRRRALGPRRAEGAGQRRRGLPDRPRLGLGAGRDAARRASPTCFQIMRQELRVAMALTGCADVNSAGRELLAD